MATQTPVRIPAHLWAVGIVSLLWNGFGACDYTMSELGNAAWFRMMGLGEPEMAYVAAFPVWAVAAWAVGVWGSVLGSVLLLMRSHHAATAYALSLLGALVSFAYQFSTEAPASMQGGVAAIMPALVTILIVAQWYYARRMTAAGVLT